jgi:hypothetical protein
MDFSIRFASYTSQNINTIENTYLISDDWDMLKYLTFKSDTDQKKFYIMPMNPLVFSLKGEERS